jgi:hypothetical protein
MAEGNIAGIQYKTFLLASEEMPPGNSFRKEIPSVSINNLRTPAGLLLTGATSPSVEISSNQLRAVVGSGILGAVIQFTVPREYDHIKKVLPKSRDLIIQVTAAVSGTDTPTIGITAVAQPGAGGAAKTGYTAATVNPTSTSTATTHTIAGSTPVNEVFDLGESLSSAGVPIQAGDDVTVTITFSAHTDNIFIYKVAACGDLQPNFTHKVARNSLEGDEQPS